MKPAALRPILYMRPFVPSGIDTMSVTPEQRAAVESMSLETFTDMINGGHSFQAALGAIYMSGIVHALEMAQPDQGSEKHG